MDFTSFIQRNIIQYLVNCLLIIFLTCDVRITGSSFLKKPVASQFLTSGNIPRAKRMRSSYIAGKGSSLVELEGWQELIRGKRNGGPDLLNESRLRRLIGAIRRLETDAEQLKAFLPDMERLSQGSAKRGLHQKEKYEMDRDLGAFLERDFPKVDSRDNSHHDDNMTPLEMMQQIEEKLQMLHDGHDQKNSKGSEEQVADAKFPLPWAERQGEVEEDVERREPLW